MGHMKSMPVKSESIATGRRAFIVSALTAAGGLAIGVSIPGFAGAVTTPGSMPQALPVGAAEVNAWILIESDDSVTVRVAKSEMGQGIMTALAMIVAEELQCDWKKIKVEYADANRNFREGQPYKDMSTGGSSGVRVSRPFMQQAGASARVRLIEAAAKRWKVPASECQAVDGQVVHAAGKTSLGYGALAADAAKINLEAEPAIKTPDQFTLIGKPQARLDTRVKVNGEAIFGMDIRVPNMLYAAVVTCPVPGGTLKSYDAKPILARRGIHSVVPLPGGAAVVADRFWRAKQAAEAMQVEWDYGAGAGVNSADIRREYRAALDGPVENAKTVGDVASVFKNGKVIEAVYEAPYLAHATMEPLNCTVHVQPDRVDIWMGTQAPDHAAGLAAEAVGMSADKIYIHNCYLGGGFGRRAANDEMMQAVAIAKTLDQPVKLVWTREEDMRHDRYRPLAAIRFRSVLDKDGMPSAIEAQTAVGSILKSLGAILYLPSLMKGLEPMAVEGLVNMPYAVPNLKVDAAIKNNHVPIMFWRSVGSSQNAFAVESFIDELAHASGQDAYRFRRKMLEGQPDYLRVLDMAAEKSNWDQKMPPGHGRGIAIHEAFGTIVSEVVEVAVDDKGKVRCERVVAVVDCGHVINPLNVAMQLESGIIYGLTAALYDEITIKDGAVEQGNFDNYQMVRMADAPKIETYLALSGGSKWGGIGEPGTPPIAPALCNAIFAATGQRIRSLPVKNTNLTRNA
jgi:isoquinoline 1-oxidoreductase beta subunit